jgi:DNA mismatch endonuclease (patch repair protein)
MFGRPDFIWRRQRIAVFVDGCFWHGHACGRNLSPKRNISFWQKKIDNNKRRDRRIARELRARNWRVLRVWECTLKKSPGRFIKTLKNAMEMAKLEHRGIEIPTPEDTNSAS